MFHMGNGLKSLGFVVLGICALHLCILPVAYSQDKDKDQPLTKDAPKAEEKKGATAPKSKFAAIEKAKQTAKTRGITDLEKDETGLAWYMVSGLAEHRHWVPMAIIATTAGLTTYFNTSNGALRNFTRDLKESIAPTQVELQQYVHNEFDPPQSRQSFRTLISEVREARRVRIRAIAFESGEIFREIDRTLTRADREAVRLERQFRGTTAVRPQDLPSVAEAYTREVAAHKELYEYVKRHENALVDRGISRRMIRRLLSYHPDTYLKTIPITSGVNMSVVRARLLQRSLMELEHYLNLPRYSLYYLEGFSDIWRWLRYGGRRAMSAVATVAVHGWRNFRAPMLMVGGVLTYYLVARGREYYEMKASQRPNPPSFTEIAPVYLEAPFVTTVTGVWETAELWRDEAIAKSTLRGRYGERAELKGEFEKFEKNKSSLKEMEERVFSLLPDAEKKQSDDRRVRLEDFRTKYAPKMPFDFKSNADHRDLMSAAFAKANEELVQENENARRGPNFSLRFWRLFWTAVFDSARQLSPEIAAIPAEQISGPDRTGDSGLIDDFAHISPHIFEYMIARENRYGSVLEAVATLNTANRTELLRNIADASDRRWVELMLPPVQTNND